MTSASGQADAIVAAGDLAAEDARRRSGRARRPPSMPEQPLAGRVEPDDPRLGVDLEDQVGRPVDDRGQLLPLALEGLAQARPLERDRELVAGQLDDPDPVGVGRATVDRPQARGG